MSPAEAPLRVINLSHSLWRKNHDLVKQALDNPFVQKLHDGSLNENRLSEYHQQDEYFQHIVRPYRQFVKKQTSENNFDPNEGIEILRQQIESASELGIEPSSETMNYIEYIFANSYSLPTAATSLVPCSKLYRFLINYLDRMKPSDIGKKWIDSHKYDGYKNNTDKLEALINHYPEKNIDELSKIYRKGLEHEIAFFSQFDNMS